MRQESCVSELEVLKVIVDEQVNQGKDRSTQINNLEQLCVELKTSCENLLTLHKQGHIRLDSERSGEGPDEVEGQSPSSELQVLKGTLDKLVSDGQWHSTKLEEL